MKVFKNITQIKTKLKNPVVAIGVFDGVHRGHQMLIKKAIKRAKAIKGTAIVMTFFPHPVHVLKKNIEMSLLVSLPHRLELIKSLGISTCVVMRFTKKFASLSAVHFIEKYLVGCFGVKEIFVGSDFHFGKAREGHGDFLSCMAKKNNFKIQVIKPVRYQKTIISSSALRKIISKGNFRKAEEFLGRRVSILGKVQHGDNRGKRLGFQTANINPGKEILPPYGVYLTEAVLGKKIYKSISNVGKRPSFKEGNTPNLEVHILNFRKNIYGKKIEVKFLKRLRSEKKFSTEDALVRAIESDRQKALSFFKKVPHSKYSN
ncbi:MAG: bifunctional riboflavin kinase/FAD synthetase [Candidatus Aceula meridiana]|nr:bifunctional riboflavin kinase/FAD synthetase [Candidatus Aceula meridiana]